MSEAERALEPDCSLCAAAPARTPRPSIGPPFRECLRCGRSATRPGATEWDFHAPRDRARLVGHRASLAVLAGAVFPLVHALVTGVTPRVWTLPMSLWTLALGWVSCGSVAALWLMAEVRRSRRRVLRDPMYRAHLVAASLGADRADKAEAPARPLDDAQEPAAG